LKIGPFPKVWREERATEEELESAWKQVVRVAESHPRLLAWLAEGQVNWYWNVFGGWIAVLRLIPGLRWMVWHFLPLDLPESGDLLEHRVIGLPAAFIALCHVLPGGLPRDLLRVARAIFTIHGDRARTKIELAEATYAVIKDEIRALNRSKPYLASTLIRDARKTLARSAGHPGLIPDIEPQFLNLIPAHPAKLPASPPRTNRD